MPGTSHWSMRARGMLVVVVVALAPWSAAAGEPTTTHAPFRTALANVRTPDRTSSPSGAAAASRAQPAGNSRESPRFFKTRAGIVVAAVMAAGVGYAIYSTQHDRIKSAGKE